MKIFVKTIASLTVSALLFVSCDKVEDPYYKTVEVDTTTTLVQKRVLLEDYTGHQCVNCPAAGNIAHNIKNALGNKVVIVAIHAGFFANPLPSGDFTADYRTLCGTEWDTFFGISTVGNPNGMVNRKNYPGDYILSPQAWSGAIATALAEPVTVDLALKNTYNSADRSLKAEIEVKFIEEMDKNLKLVVLLTESGIVSPQKNNDAEVGTTPIIMDYVHQHVLRGSINDTWGDPVAVQGTANPESLTKTYSYTIPAAYNAENCAVVAFVYDDDTKEVLQVIEKEL